MKMVVLYLAGLMCSLLYLLKKKRFRKPALLLLAGSLVASAVFTVDMIAAKDGKVWEIERAEKSGNPRTVELEAQAADEIENILIKIAPQSYSLQELEQLSERLFAELEEKIPGKENTLDCVTSDMYFPAVAEGYPFTLKWQTDHPDILSQEGKIGEDIPPEGVLIQIRLHLFYANTSFEAEHLFYAMIYPSGDDAAYWNRLKKYLERQEMDSREKNDFLLPDRFEDRELLFQEKKSDKSQALFLLSVVAALLMAAGEKQEQDRQKKKKLKEMAEEYPELAVRMAMLTGTGMTISTAFRRIAGEYGRQKQKKEKPLYEELMITCREMETGIPEITAYQNMGKRCSLSCVARFTTLLIQYTKSGAKGLKTALQEESAQALKERRERAKRKGEEAGTRLLLPMTLMLVLVMAIIMIPALTSFGL